MTTVVLGRIHALMMTSNVWRSNWRQVQDRCPQFPLNINKDPRCRAQPAAICGSSYHLFPHIYHAPLHKKSCKQQLKMKYDIALRQNWNQSATVWWSTQSSARHWRVKERHLILNKSTDNMREPHTETNQLAVIDKVLSQSGTQLCVPSVAVQSRQMDFHGLHERLPWLFQHSCLIWTQIILVIRQRLEKYSSYIMVHWTGHRASV